MRKKKYLAHSAEKNTDGSSVAEHLYCDHINNVIKLTKGFAQTVIKNINIDESSKKAFLQAIILAAIYHDLGKLDDQCQKILHKELQDVRMLNHVDAGVAYMLKQYSNTENATYVFAAILIYAHHISLPNFNNTIIKKHQEFFRIVNNLDQDKIRDNSSCVKYKMSSKTVKNHVDENLENYIKIHHKQVKEDLEKIEKIDLSHIFFKEFVFFRMALSILIDADHIDTAKNYGDEEIYKSNQLNIDARITKIDQYVESLQNKAIKNKRNELRREIYDMCKKFTPKTNISLLDLYVGVGKTTCGFRVASNHVKKNPNCNSMLFVTPYIALNDQTGNTLKNSTTLKNSDSEISIIHSIFEYKSKWLKRYAKDLYSPISILTGVSLFNILFKNKTSLIAKFHKIAGSVIMIDEYHILSQHKHWKIILHMISDLVKYFNVQVVFSSGTPVEFWNIDQISKKTKKSKKFTALESFLEDFNIESVLDSNLKSKMLKLENKRVKYNRLKEVSLEELVEHVNGYEGSLLVVLETIAKCSSFAENIQLKTSKNVFMRHSGLTPKDRHKHIEKAKEKIKNGEDVILISTPGGNVGLDLSFKHGFQDNAGLENLLQTSGRINRNDEFKDSTLTHFSLTGFRGNPHNNESKKILQNHINNNGEITPEECTKLIQSEFNEAETEGRALIDNVLYYNKIYDDMNYKEVSKNVNVIEQPSINVLIDKTVYNNILNNKFVKFSEIQENVVNIVDYKGDMFNRLLSEQKISLVEEDVLREHGERKNEKFRGYGELCFWWGDYDPKMLGIRVDNFFQR